MRPIRLKILIGGGLGYRLYIIFFNTLFFLFGLKESPWNAFKYAIVWNIINTILYFLYHYIFVGLFKYGKEK